jgi:hypothetical protein
MSIKNLVLVLGLFANIQGVLALQLDNNHQAEIEKLKIENDRKRLLLEGLSFAIGGVSSSFVPSSWSVGCLALSVLLSSQFELERTEDYSDMLLRNNDSSQNRVIEKKAYLSNKLPHGLYWASLGLCAGHFARAVVKR